MSKQGEHNATEKGYESVELARTSYGEIPERLSAAACVNCAECAARCINGLNISQKWNGRGNYWPEIYLRVKDLRGKAGSEKGLSIRSSKLL